MTRTLIRTIATLSAGVAVLAGLLVILAHWPLTPVIIFTLVSAVMFGLDGLIRYVRAEIVEYPIAHYAAKFPGWRG